MASPNQKPIIWKLVLTGGPCAGKTTGQAKISTVFERFGWKVYRVPETATLLLSGGVKFHDMSPEEAKDFQANLLKTMIQIENTFFDLAKKSKRNCLVICDRGAMDASAFISGEGWESILSDNGLNEVEIRDNRYDQVIHLASAANGAETFYTTENNPCRTSDMEAARIYDIKTAEAWVGHPNFQLIGNDVPSFQDKINRVISEVALSIGLDIGDQFTQGIRRVKFVIDGPLPSDVPFPETFRDFEVVFHVLQTPLKILQSRLTKRGRKGKWNYIHTIRKVVSGQEIELSSHLTHREYLSLLFTQEDPEHFPVYKTQRCFLWKNQYYQLDIYGKDPCDKTCKGMTILETFTTLPTDQLKTQLPYFLQLGPEITGDPAFTMYNLSLK